VDGNAFPQSVVAANHHALAIMRGIKVVVLRRETHTHERIKCITGTYQQWAAKIHIGNQLTAAANLDLTLNNAAWSDGHIVGQFGSKIDSRTGMDRRHAYPPNAASVV